jgi:glycosyltransferase involved in cell wall biosynthesis
MIAPEPFFEPRGTPFSEYFRIKALSQLGHNIDLITYPIGEDKHVPGLRIFRSLRLPFIKSVKTGPSWEKVFLDFFLFFRVLRQLMAEDYDLIHTHEEGNIMGVLFNKFFGIPHLYDMHSSLVQQMDNFQFTRSKIIVNIFRIIERLSLRNASSVIVICHALREHAAGITVPSKLNLIENFIDETPETLDRKKISTIRRVIEKDKKKIIMYTGTLEPYQGIPQLIDTLQVLPDYFRLVIIGGKPSQVLEVSQTIKKKNLQERVLLLGKRDMEEIPYYLRAADVLISPRIRGTNIPLKIYGYLKSGIPVVATNLYTHTQLLSEDIAFLVEPEPEKIANGIQMAVGERGKEISRNALKFCRENFSRQRYLDLVAKAVHTAVRSSPCQSSQSAR